MTELARVSGLLAQVMDGLNLFWGERQWISEMAALFPDVSQR